ncbi:MAG: hypothetical protein GX567_10755 [Clostridia bacterium]|nr:hypothetical protein [Clostridia bacterium]
MSVIILCILAAVEVLLAVWCIKNQTAGFLERAYVRAGELTLFVIFTIIPVLKGGLRYQLLAAALVIRAIVALIVLWRQKKKEDAHKQTYRVTRVVIRAAGSVLVFAVALIPAFIFPQYQEPRVTGTHEVATAVYTYEDPDRIESFNSNNEPRKVTVEFWYPKDWDHNEQYPLVLFSHGAFGVRSANTSTYQELASNGYVVGALDHPYHSMFSSDAMGNITLISQDFLASVLACNNGTYVDREKYEQEQQWMKLRVADIEFILDRILKEHATSQTDKEQITASQTEKEEAADSQFNEDNQINEVFRMIDPKKIGMAGHSLGGAAGAQVAREKNDIDAVVCLDATMMGEYVDYDDESHCEIFCDEPYPVPIIRFYTDDIMKALEQLPEDSEFVDRVAGAGAPADYEVYYEHTNHMSLTDLTLVSPCMVKLIVNTANLKNGAQTQNPRQVLESMNSTILHFFDYYLKGQGDNNEIT